MQTEPILQQIQNSKGSMIKYAVTDIDGILRAKMVHKKKLLKGLESGLGFCDVIFGWDANDVPYDNIATTGLHTGYPDAFAQIDTTTFRTIPWQDNLSFVLADFSGSTMEAICPRSLLKKVVQKANDMGFTPRFAIELEWFNFKETPQSLAEKNYRTPQPLTPGMFGYSELRLSQQQAYLNQLVEQSEQFGLPLESLHTETGDGVLEAALLHDEALKAADKAVLFKMAVKEIAYQHGIFASFMAKWNAKLPGCSGHIHQSLWSNVTAQNAFAYNERMSPLMQQYLAGQLACLPYLLPMFAPTVNSYKRLAGGDWAPATVTWGIENRTTAFRVINHTPAGTRIEGRVAGADVNPYLAMAAYLAAGLYGIEQELTLEHPAVEGTGYDKGLYKQLPLSLNTAIEQMQQSELPTQLFGEQFVSHFIATRQWEWQQYQQQVSNWELQRYFEVI